MRWAVFAISASLWCAALPARAQDVLDDARLSSVRERLAGSIESARREGLPSEWLVDKVAEGLSKRVPPARIAAAVEELAARIRAADALVEPVGRADRRRVLRAAVDALAAGAPRRELGQLVREVARSGGPNTGGRVREALVTVAELAERQFGGAAAVEATREAHRRGEPPRELLRRARRIGRDPPGGRDRALRELGRGRGPGQRDVDARGVGRDHGRDGNPGRGPR